MHSRVVLLLVVAVVAVGAAPPNQGRNGRWGGRRVPCGTRASGSILASDVPRSQQPNPPFEAYPTMPGDCGFTYAPCPPQGFPDPVLQQCLSNAYQFTKNAESALTTACREPIPDGAPDISGVWQAYTSPLFALNNAGVTAVHMAAMRSGMFFRHEQCGYRAVMMGHGSRHDGWCTGNWAGAMFDFSGPFTPTPCTLGGALFSYESIATLSSTNTHPLLTTVYDDAISDDAHVVSVLLADQGFAHRFRIECPATLPTQDAAGFVIQQGPDLQEPACMRIVVNLFPGSVPPPPPLVFDLIRLDMHNDYANCRPEKLRNVRQHI